MQYFSINYLERNWRLIFFGFFLAIAFSMWTSFIVLGKSKYIDESYHLKQIFRFLKGDFNLVSQITTLPGYHAAIASVASFLNDPSSNTIRFISLFFSMISIWIFFLLAKKLDDKNSYLKTLQFVFFPLSFLYFPLVYTDIFSLLILLTAFYFLLSRRYNLSAFFCLLSLLVRQNNIVWVLFFWIYGYVLENGYALTREKIIKHLKQGSAFILVALFFLVFLLINKGIAIGDQDRQSVGFHLGNVYFFLVSAGFLFWPILVGSLLNLKQGGIKKRIIIGSVAGIIFAFAFLFFRPMLHEYNLASGFLRNNILSAGYNQFAWLYAAIIFLGCLVISTMGLKREMMLVFPFTFAYLVPSWLVEQRYLIIPFVLILLLRKKTNRIAEYLNLAYFSILSAGLLYMVLEGGIFF